MRHARLVLALAGAAFVAGTIPAAGVAKAPTVIRLVSITTSSREQDRPPPGPSAGDSVKSTSRLLNAVAQFSRPKGAVVGSDRGTMTLKDSSSIAVEGSARLPGGTIVFRGLVRAGSGGSVVIPVTGGSGRFAGARGTLTVVDLDTKRASNVYRLTFRRS